MARPDALTIADATLDLLAARDVARSPHALADEDERRDYQRRCRSLESGLKRLTLIRLIIVGGHHNELALAELLPPCVGPDASPDLVCPWCGLLGAHRYGLCWTRMTGDLRDAARELDPIIGLYANPIPYDGDPWPADPANVTVEVRLGDAYSVPGAT